MTQAHVRAAIKDYYNYRLLEKIVSKKDIDNARVKIQNRYRQSTENWDKAKNSEWVLRNYLAIKMIMSATLMLNSMEYAKDKNLRIVEPYLSYYSLLTVCRALIFVTPENKWNNGELMTMNHGKIIQNACNSIRSIDQKLGFEIEEILTQKRDLRELYSYKFPADGLITYFYEEGNSWETLVNLSTVVAEVAQFYSEQLQFCTRKVGEDKFTLDFNFLENGFLYKGKKYEFIDKEDLYRLGYFKRKQPYPLNLYWTLREGMVDDFFGAWQMCEDDDGYEVDVFDPDKNIRLIFNMP